MSDILKDDRLISTHLGDDYSQYMGAVVPPVFMNSLHVFEKCADYYGSKDLEGSGHEKFVYGRVSNPTVTIVEKKIAALENGKKALLFASGMAATTSAIMATCNAGSHIICIKNAYGPVKTFLDNVCIPKLNMSVTYVKGDDVDEVREAIKPNTSLIILESPSTFVFSLMDLRAIATLAKKNGIKTYVDNSFCTPIFQKPLDLGIDIVMHTASKYLGGHSDIIGGVLASNDEELMNYIQFNMRELYGGIMGPMEAWLVMRGLRTLHIRVKEHEATAMAVAKYLENHTKVKKVNYPGLESHPQYELMKEQQTGNSGLLSFELDGTIEDAVKFIDNLEHFKIGCSWGGFESLALPVMYKASQEELDFLGTSKTLIRLHCGLEGADNLIADLDRSFNLI